MLERSDCKVSKLQHKNKFLTGTFSDKKTGSRRETAVGGRRLLLLHFNSRASQNCFSQKLTLKRQERAVVLCTGTTTEWSCVLPEARLEHGRRCGLYHKHRIPSFIPLPTTPYDTASRTWRCTETRAFLAFSKIKFRMDFPLQMPLNQPGEKTKTISTLFSKEQISF